MVFSQKTEPIYYNEDWKVTTKDKALFYRLTPIKELGEMILLQDFYINGTPQFEGYTFKDDENNYVGDIVWYDEHGNDTTFRIYPNSTEQSTLTYYYPNGKVRKVVEYKKGWKDKETIFHEDGTVLMKGFFEEGKPAKGEFANVNNRDRYEEIMMDGKTTITNTVLQPLPPISPTETEIVENSPEAKENEKKATVTEKIFWANSKQIAQETVYRIESYDYKLIQQKNYDKTGKLLQTLTEKNFEKYSSRILHGSEYQYYLHNNFATALKSISNFVKKQQSGKNVSYHPNGKIATETLFVDGYREGEELVYSENGTLKTKRIYKNNEPFTGNFEEKSGDFSLNINYVNGKKEGEAIAKNEAGEIIAKGIYKNNVPFNGTFITGDYHSSDYLEFINVVDYKKTGLQKAFKYRLENLVKIYTMQDDKLNGPTTFYQKEKPVSTLEYKNDEPYEGTMVEGKTTTIYKNGKLVSETTLKNHYDNSIENQKLYENGELVKVISGNFFIPDVQQNSYEGIYKNGKPYSGYFETEDDREFKQVDYYENGEKKFQYSNDYLKNMDNYSNQYYDIKSTYKNGKIFDGVNYQLRDRQYISGYYKNGILQNFDWDLFAVHYFNRIGFKLMGNTIEMTELQEGRKASIVVDVSKNSFTKKLLVEGNLVDTKTYNDDKTKNASIILYTIEKEKLVSKTMEMLDSELDISGESELMYKVYISIDNQSGSIQDIFNHLAENIGSEEWIKGEVSRDVLTALRIDASGIPQEGILITENKDKTFSLKSYINGKMEKQVQNITIKNLEKEVKKLENNY